MNRQVLSDLGPRGMKQAARLRAELSMATASCRPSAYRRRRVRAATCASVATIAWPLPPHRPGSTCGRRLPHQPPARRPLPCLLGRLAPHLLIDSASSVKARMTRENMDPAGSEPSSSTPEQIHSCPLCAGRLIRIVYGFPDASAIRAASEGRVLLAGCKVRSPSPEWRCSECQRSFTGSDLGQHQLADAGSGRARVQRLLDLWDR